MYLICTSKKPLQTNSSLMLSIASRASLTVRILRYEIEKGLRAVCHLSVFDVFVAQLGSDLDLLFVFVFNFVLIVFVFVVSFVFVSASNLCAF